MTLLQPNPRLEIPVLKHQLELLLDRENFEIALVAGYSSGKSKGLVFKHLDLAGANLGYISLYSAPTFPMLNDVSIPDFEWALEMMDIPYEYKKTPSPQITVDFGSGTHKILFRATENWRRWRGLNLSHFSIDEIDTIERTVARKAWEMGLSRLKRASGNVYQAIGGSTPEGFGFMYEYFEKGQKPNRRLIRAKTMDNPFIDADGFVDALRENYPPHLLKAYLDGEFVPLGGNLVYEYFSREQNKSTLTLEDARKTGKRLYVGMDFNVLKKDGKGGMSAVTHILEDDRNPHAIDEILGSRDTPAIIQAMKERYQGFEVIVYPDPSSASSSSKGVNLTDIRLLEDAGYTCLRMSKAPAIRDRVNSMNAQFLNGQGVRRYRVNPDTCKGYVECLEKQCFGKDGMPEKGEWDGPIDAAGYYIFREFGVTSETRSAWIGGR